MVELDSSCRQLSHSPLVQNAIIRRRSGYLARGGTERNGGGRTLANAGGGPRSPTPTRDGETRARREDDPAPPSGNAARGDSFADRRVGRELLAGEAAAEHGGGAERGVTGAADDHRGARGGRGPVCRPVDPPRGAAACGVRPPGVPGAAGVHGRGV